MMTLEHIRRRQKIQYNKRRGKYVQIENLAPRCANCNRKKNSLSLILFLGTRTTNNVERYWKKVGNWHSV